MTPAKMTRRVFLELGLTALASAYGPTPAPSATPTTTPTSVRTATPTSLALPTPAKAATPTHGPALRIIYPDDPAILYTGRIDFSNPQQPEFSAPGVYLRARFRGTGAVALLQDESKCGTNRNYYDVVIDDTTIVKLAPAKTTTRYEVATDLPNTDHTLTLIKRTEAGVGYGRFLGLEFAGDWRQIGYRPENGHPGSRRQAQPGWGREGPRDHADPIFGLGCGPHPNVQQHEAMAAELASYLAPLMDWA